MSVPLSIYLVSKSEEESQLLRGRLEPSIEPVGAISYVSLRPQGLLVSPEARKAALIVLNFSEWNMADLQIIEDVWVKFTGTPILILAKHDAPHELNAYLSIGNIAYLAKPFENRDLIGIVKKFIVNGGVATQVHRRFTTNQEATLEVHGSVMKVPSRVVNLSKGGAFIQLGGDVAIRVGDEVRVTLALKQVNREYTMPAKVVWTKLIATTVGFAGDQDRGGGIGVAFTGPGDVKKNIIPVY
jgi:Tfp pilus assembly protein PilZ